jgi:ribosomal protein L12E/L44/L45/RPP1/RPP2
VYCVVNTARSKDPEFFKGFGVVAFDEAHEYQAPSSSKMLWTAQAPCLIGLSATPDERADKMDRLLFPFLGAPLSLEAVVPPNLIENINFEGRVREVRYMGHPDHAQDVYVESKGTVSSILTIGKIIQDPHRLEMVAAEAALILNMHKTLPPDQLADWGLGPCPETGKFRRHSLFVFAEHRAYLPTLQKLLARCLADVEDLNMMVLMEPDEGDRGMMDRLDTSGGTPAATPAAGAAAATPAAGAAAATPAAAAPVATPSIVLRGGVSEEHREFAKKTRLVLTTYGFSRRGISLPQMTAMVMATPRRTGMTQILGRINRLTPDKSLRGIKRFVTDIVDVKISLAGQASDRRQAYWAKDWPVHRVKVEYSAYPEGENGALGAPPIGTGKLVARRKKGADRDEPDDAGAQAGAKYTLADLT